MDFGEKSNSKPINVISFSHSSIDNEMKKAITTRWWGTGKGRDILQDIGAR